ncbi:hypothetical protein [Acidithiobacillus thiooxidans]|nr:hypothetical protein [Acidithiobacillus thiooxidans]
MMYSEHGWSSLEGDRARVAEEQARQAASSRARDEEEQRQRQYQAQQMRDQQSAQTYNQSSTSGGSILSNEDIHNLLMLPVLLVLLPFELVRSFIGWVRYGL